MKWMTADGGYRGNIKQEVFKNFGYLLKNVLRKDNRKQRFKPFANRWIVEQTFAQFDTDRRLCRSNELLMEPAEEMTKRSIIQLLINKSKKGSYSLSFGSNTGTKYLMTKF